MQEAKPKSRAKDVWLAGCVIILVAAVALLVSGHRAFVNWLLLVVSIANVVALWESRKARKRAD